jgi:hypothetical protein
MDVIGAAVDNVKRPAPICARLSNLRLHRLALRDGQNAGVFGHAGFGFQFA